MSKHCSSWLGHLTRSTPLVQHWICMRHQRPLNSTVLQRTPNVILIAGLMGKRQLRQLHYSPHSGHFVIQALRFTFIFAICHFIYWSWLTMTALTTEGGTVINEMVRLHSIRPIPQIYSKTTACATLMPYHIRGYLWTGSLSRTWKSSFTPHKQTSTHGA